MSCIACMAISNSYEKAESGIVRAVSVRVGLHFRVAFSENILEALLQQQPLK